MFNFRILGQTGNISIIFHSFVSFLLLSAAFNISAQNQFQLAIGGISEDRSNSIIRTMDGGYASAGSTRSFGAGSYDFYIVKFDANGTLQWSRTLGGTNGDHATSIIQTTDGGYAVAGFTESFGAGGNDLYVVKLSSSGSVQWSKAIGGTGDDIATSILQTTDGGYIISGYTDSFGAGETDMYIVKLTGTGILQWSRAIGGVNSERANEIIQTTDGGFAVAGYTGSFGAGGEDFCIAKLSSSGSVQWVRTFGGTGHESAYCIIQTTDGGYAVAGATQSFGAGQSDFYILKLGSGGTFQWSKCFGGTDYDYAFSIIQTLDGGYAAAGWTRSFGAGGEDFCIFKIDAGGTLQWRRTAGGANNEEAFSVIQTADSGYIVAGYTMSFGAGNFDIYIVKFDAGGNTCGNSTSPTFASGTGGIFGNPTLLTAVPTPAATSPTSISGTGGTVTSICAIGIKRISEEIPVSYELYQNYPNPFNPSTNIKFSILPSKGAREMSVTVTVYDLLGREVTVLVNQQLRLGTYEVEWDDVSNHPSGVYFYKLMVSGAEGQSFTDVKKMVLLK